MSPKRKCSTIWNTLLPLVVARKAVKGYCANQRAVSVRWGPTSDLDSTLLRMLTSSKSPWPDFCPSCGLFNVSLPTVKQRIRQLPPCNYLGCCSSVARLSFVLAAGFWLHTHLRDAAKSMSFFCRTARSCNDHPRRIFCSKVPYWTTACPSSLIITIPSTRPSSTSSLEGRVRVPLSQISLRGNIFCVSSSMTLPATSYIFGEGPTVRSTSVASIVRHCATKLCPMQLP
jgi:hypothetical protein